MRGSRGVALRVGLFGAALAAVGIGAVLLVPTAEKGDVDPVGVLIGGASLLAGIVAAWLAWQAHRHATADPVVVAGRLAVRVWASEGEARRQLLGGDGEVIDVRFVRRASLQPAAGSLVEGQLAGIADYYRSLDPQRLVILGAPGAGKTVAAIDLVLALADPRTRSSTAPVPVRLSMASWAEVGALPDADGSSRRAGQPGLLAAWLVRALVDVYGLSRTGARSLVDAGMILPVLDGLDEMDAAEVTAVHHQTRARRAVDILNASRHGTARTAMVVTCRTAAYQGLSGAGAQVRDAACVEITAVSVAQAREYIDRRAREPVRWQPIRERLDVAPSSVVARALRTPWRLNVAVDAYEHQDPSTGDYLYDPADLLRSDLTSDGSLQRHLLRLYFVGSATAVPPPGRSDPQAARSWLGTLADYLNRNAAAGRSAHGRSLSGRDLVLHELWPLVGSRRVQVTEAFIAVAVAGPFAFGFLALLCEYVGAAVSWRYTVGFVATAVLFPVIVAADHAQGGWPRALRIGWPAHGATHRRALVRALARGGTMGLVMALLFALLPRLLLDGSWEPSWASLPFIAMLAAAVMVENFVNGGLDVGEQVVAGPLASIRGDLAFSALAAVTGGLSLAALTGIMVFAANSIADYGDPLALLVSGTLFGASVGLLRGAVWRRYLAIRLCARHRSVRLPWPLGRHMAWAHEAGILRVAGNAYQFRHQELQDWLADPGNQV